MGVQTEQNESADAIASDESPQPNVLVLRRIFLFIVLFLIHAALIIPGAVFFAQSSSFVTCEGAGRGLCSGPSPYLHKFNVSRPLLGVGFALQVILWCFLFSVLGNVLCRFIALLTPLFLISAALIIPGAIAFQRPVLINHVREYGASVTLIPWGIVLQFFLWVFVYLKLRQIYLAHKSGVRPQERCQNDNSGNDGYPNGNSSGNRLGSSIARGIDKMILGCWSRLSKAGYLGKISRGPSTTSEYDLDNQTAKHI